MSDLVKNPEDGSFHCRNLHSLLQLNIRKILNTKWQSKRLHPGAYKNTRHKRIKVSIVKSGKIIGDSMF